MDSYRKSSHSTGGNCVEVGAAGQVGVRDTKDNGAGPVLSFGPAQWAAFTAKLKG
jgi:hypothetical protein